jgi:hypothetical protein
VTCSTCSISTGVTIAITVTAATDSRSKQARTSHEWGRRHAGPYFFDSCWSINRGRYDSEKTQIRNAPNLPVGPEAA